MASTTSAATIMAAAVPASAQASTSENVDRRLFDSTPERLPRLRPGTVLKVRTGGEACAHIVDGSLTVNAFFDRHDVRFQGCKLRRARLIGDGLIAASESWLSAQASFSGTIRW